MKPISNRIRFLKRLPKQPPSRAIAAVVIVLCGWLAPCADAQQVVDVHLHGPFVSCFKETIAVKDVAEITGGTSSLRQQVGDLDLDEFTDLQRPLLINSRTIRYRIILAGIDESQFRLSGSAKTHARFSETIDVDERIRQALIEQLAQQFQLPEDSFELTILSSLGLVTSNAKLDPGTLTVVPKFRAEMPVGRQTVDVRLSDATGRSLTVKVSVKISVFRDLVMAKQNISRGETLTEENITRVRRPVESHQVRFASYEQSLGKEAQSSIQQFSLLKAQYVRNAQPKSTYVVQRNDRLNIHIQRGAMRVTLKNARAMEKGKIGDFIQFVNPKSNKPVFARIVNGSIAVVEM